MPTTPKRWAIWQAIQAAMQTIAAPTYNFTVQDRYVSIGAQSLEGGDRVRIEVFPGDGVHEPEAFDSTESTLTCDVFGWLRPNKDENGFQAIEKPLQDIINAAHADITLGGLVVRTWCTQTEVDDGLDDLDRDWRWCRAQFEIQQFHGFTEH